MTDDAREHLLSLGVTDDVIDATPPEHWYLLVQDHLFFGGPPTLTAAQLGASCGVDAGVVRRLWRMLGFPDPEDRVVFRPQDAAMLRLYEEGVAVFGDEPIDHFTRTLGEATRRISEATTSLFLEVLGETRRVSSRREHLQLAELGGALMARIPDDILRTAVLHHARESQLFVGAAGGADSPQLDVAVGFCDLVGSTSLLNTADTAAIGRAVRAFEAAASERVVARRGRVVKLIGDEVMFTTVDVRDAEAVAVELVRWVSDHEVLGGARAGVAFGPVLARGGDLYGSTVNLAARLTSVAADGTVLVADPAGADRVALRGFDEAVAVRTISA